MRTLFVSLLAISAIALPAVAQTQSPQHGIRTGNIAFTYTGEVLPGQDGAFKQLVQKVIAARYKNQVAAYLQQIAPNLPLKEKLRRLVRIRVAEGYMAELVPEKGDTFLLVENHCPICAAAKVCRGFCTTEQDLFRAVLGQNVTVERVEHIVVGDRRCAYGIREHVK